MTTGSSTPPSARNQSEVNTSTTPLTGAATFTGTFEQNAHQDVMISCQTDAAGTLYLDFSVDGTNYSTFPTAGFAVSAGIHEFHQASKGPRYFRTRLVNGSAAQSYLRLYVYFGSFTISNAASNQSIGLDSDAIAVRSTDYQDEVRRGLRGGVTAWNKWGYREALTKDAADELIWATTGNMTFLTTASTFTIAYDGTGGGTTDGAGTTGATQLYFYYIDSTGLPAISAHTLETDGSDVTAFSGLGINRCVVSLNGGATYNVSAITVTATTGGSKQAYIPAAQSVTQQCVFFNGSNHISILKYLDISIDVVTKTANVLIKGYVYNREFDTRYEVYRTNIDTSVTLSASLVDPTGFALNATDTLYFAATADSSNVDIHCRFSVNQYQKT